MPDPFTEIASQIRGFIRRGPEAPGGDTEFDALALELFARQREHNPAYAKLCAGEPRSWREIPAVPTVAFKELELTSLPLDERQRVFYSSGTTQQDRSRHFHNATSLALYDESLLTWFRENFSHERAWFDVLVLTPQTVHAPNSSLAHMFEAFVHNCFHRGEFFGAADPSGNWQLAIDAVIEKLQKHSSEGRSLTLLGTAFQLVQLLDALQEKELVLELPAGSWILETGGYKGRSRALTREELRRSISERLGIPATRIFSEYGMSELSSQAYDRADGVFHFPPWARAVLISPATGREVAAGERGLIRVFDLANVWSVMAMQTEDIGIKAGDGFSLAGRAPQSEARGCSLMTL